MLYQIGLEGSGTRPTYRTKPVQHIIERDGLCETLVHNNGDSLPKDLYQENTPKISTRPLGNQDNFLSCDILGQRPILELCLNYGNNLLIVGGIRCVIPCGFMPALSEVFYSHYRWAAREV